MAKSRVKRASKKKPLNLPSFLPGIRGSAKWHVREAREGEVPHTLNQMGGAGEMAIPLDGSPLSEFIKLHELLHAAHSPVEEPRDIIGPDHQILSTHYLIIAEELRINLMCRTYVGPDNVPDQEEDLLETSIAKAARFFQTKDPKAFLDYLDWMLIVWSVQPGQLTLYPRSTNDVRKGLIEGGYLTGSTAYEGQLFLQLVDEVVYGIGNLWEDELTELFTNGTTPSWDSVLRIAEYLDRMYTQLAQMLDPAQGESNHETGEDPDLEDFRREHQIKDEDGNRPGAERPPAGPREMRQRLQETIEKMGQTPEYDKRDKRDPIWGRMTTRVAKLTRSLPRKLVSRSKYRATDEGAVPRYVHRLPVDGKIFGRKKKSPGGTVLIDDSGSMSFSTEDLEAIMKAAPAVNIAAYSGHIDKGELVILGKDGKYADPTEDGSARPYGGNNLVDLPALEWLATMPKPRLWVSDTYVTIRGGDIERAYEQVYRLCKQKDINIVPDARTAKAVFEGKQEIYR